MLRILVFAGSARRDSWNKKLARLAAQKIDATGDLNEARFLDLADYPMPLYDGDLEAESGLPESAERLKKEFLDASAILIACPEYNSSITPLLKNTIDWLSRPSSKDEPGLAAFRGKVAAIVAASPGGLGGMRGLVHVRSILSNIGVFVIPDQLAVGSAHRAFDDDGQLTDERSAARLDAIVESLVDVTGRMTAVLA